MASDFNPVQQSSNQAAQGIIGQVRQLECPQPQEQLQEFYGQGKQERNLQRLPQRGYQPDLLSQKPLPEAPQQENHEGYEQNQVFDGFCGKLPLLIVQPPAAQHLRQGIGPHVPVEERPKQNHGGIEGQEEGSAEGGFRPKGVPPAPAYLLPAVLSCIEGQEHEQYGQQQCEAEGLVECREDILYYFFCYLSQGASPGFLLCVENHFVYSGKLRLSVINLAHIDLATEENQHWHIDKWAALFKITIWEENKMIAQRDDSILSAANTIWKLTQEEKIR